MRRGYSSSKRKVTDLRPPLPGPARGGGLPPRPEYDGPPLVLSEGSYWMPEKARRHFGTRVLDRLNRIGRRR